MCRSRHPFWRDAPGSQNIASNVGSTAVITVMIGKEVYTAWAGDAESALVRKGGEVTKFVITLHKASNEVCLLVDRVPARHGSVFDALPAVLFRL